MRGSLIVLSCLVAVQGVAPAATQESMVDFLSEEAKVITASRQPQPASESPATVYVITQQDIKASGALNIWDALRSVPGLDVMSTRTSDGNISGRGFNRAINNRMLIVIDGRPVPTGFYEYTVWDSLPVQMDEIDRIEVV